MDRRFADRAAAGRLLAARLRPLTLPAPVVLGLARGGVEVAAPVAEELAAPLDVLVVRKVGHPRRPELGLGAVTEDGGVLWDEVGLSRSGLVPADLARQVAAAQAECRRRVDAYRSGRPRRRVEGRCAVVVDDGVATGVTARGALRMLRDAGAARLVVAAPVVSAHAVPELLALAGDVVALVTDDRLRAVSQWYDDFRQTTDARVTELLRTRSGTGPPEPHG